MKRCAKKKFKKTTVNLIIVKNPTNNTEIRHTYFEIKSILTNYEKSTKTVYTECDIAQTITQGQFIYNKVDTSINLLKTEN